MHYCSLRKYACTLYTLLLQVYCTALTLDGVMAKMYSPLSEATILVMFSSESRGSWTVRTWLAVVGLEMWNCGREREKMR